MDRAYYLPSGDGGGKWEHRPDQYGPALMMMHPDVKEFCYIKGTQEGQTQQASAGAIQDVMNGYSTVYYTPNDTKAREQMQKIFNHWIDSTPEVLEELRAEYSTQKVPENDSHKKAFMDATLYSYGAKTASNTASITVQRGYIDEPDRIDSNVGGEGGIIGLLSGRFRAMTSGKLTVFGSPTTKNGRIWKYLSSFKHIFECYWPCPECGEMQTADWGSPKLDYGFKWDSVYESDNILDIDKTAATTHYVCKKCKTKIEEYAFRDQLRECQWFSSTGLLFDVNEGKGEFKSKGKGDKWRVEKAPAKVGGRKTKDGIGLYSMTSWEEGARGFLEAVNYFHITNDAEELLQPQFNTYRGTIWESRSQGDVPANVVLDLREDGLAGKIPSYIEWIAFQVDFQKRFCKYLITGYCKNGKKTDVYCFKCKRIEGRTEDPHAEMWGKLSKLVTDEYEREDGEMLRISRVIADAGHEPENVIKWCSEDPTHRLGVFGRPGTVGGLQRVMFDFSNEAKEKGWKTYTVQGREYGGYGIPINPHKASKRVYSRLSIKKGTPGAFHFAKTDDFNQDFADEAVADKHSRKKSNGEEYDHYEKEDSVPNEAHDLLKYSEANVYVYDKYGAAVPMMEPAHVAVAPPRQKPEQKFKAFGQFKP